MSARHTTSSAQQPLSWEWLTGAAFIIALALVIGRATINEVLREPFAAVYGGEAGPRLPGAATGMVLNLLICLPALLVLLRRVVDSSYTLRLSWSFLPLAGLSGWMMASPLWAGGDRFAAVVGATHWATAMVLLWTAVQLVRDWGRLRVVAGVCFGLLLIYTVHGYIYRFVEWPILLERWEQQRDEFFAVRGWEAGHHLAEQFEGKLLRGEILGFGASPNTYAAMLVLLSVVTIGVIVQRARNRDEWLWPGIMLATLPFTAWMLYLTQSRTAWATMVLAVAMLGGMALVRRRLAAFPRAAFLGGTVAVLLISAAVVAHGLRYGTLFHISLTFRWMYWLGSSELFRDSWLAGVGWNNFAQHYLAYRLAAAPEEIRDPHNFIVRFFVELGVVGGILLLAWMARLWWELAGAASGRRLEHEEQDDSDVADSARGRPPAAAPKQRRQAGPETTMPVGGASESAVAYLVMLGSAGMLVNVFAGLDWSIAIEDLGLELLKRLLYLCVLVIGMVVVTLTGTQKQALDERPARWMLYGVIVGLGIFLVHNLVDFSLFETGPLFVFALLAGAALGMRMGDGKPRAARGPGPLLVLGSATLLWLLAMVALVVPIVRAEELAYAGDENVRTGYFARAAGQFQRAHAFVPYNGDYPFRAARALINLRADPRQVRAMLAIAIATDPMATGYYLERARYELAQRPVDREGVLADYERVLKLNPNDARLRFEYARVLTALEMPAEARRQYELALRYDSQLPLPRLTPDQLEQIEQFLREPAD